MKLVLVRHGQTASNVSGALDTGRPGRALNAVGREQAQSLAQRWDTIAPTPHALAVSPLLRTRQTAQPLLDRYKGLEPMVREGLREIRGGNLEMSAALADIAQYMLAVLPWLNGDWQSRMPGGESGFELLTRALPAVAEVLCVARERGGEDATAVVVAHGAINRVIASALSPQIGPNLVMMYRLDNTGTCVLEAAGDLPFERPDAILGRFTALTWNDIPMDQWEIPEELHASLTYGK